MACDEPGLLISRTYPVEYDELNNQFCWIGSEGTIQLVLPVTPAQPLKCALKLIPHPRVDITAIQIQVNDQDIPHANVPKREMVELQFEVPTGSHAQISILLLNLMSIRPSDSGENTDDRQLAARFFGVELTAI